jgi:hypothetical protein
MATNKQSVSKELFMHKGFKTLSLSKTIAAFLFATCPALATVYVDEGFESNSIAGYEQETEGRGSFRIISGGDAREGNRYLSITKNQEAERYELRFARHLKPGEAWYGFSMRLPHNLPNPNGSIIVAQWHIFPDPGENWHRPDAIFRLNPGYRISFSHSWDSRRITPPGSRGEGRRDNIPLLTMNRGQWYDFVVRYRYSYTNNGLIEIYGAPAGSQLQLLQRLTGPNSFNDARGQFRLGPYGKDDPDYSIDVDAVRVGDSLDEVRPR